MCGNNTTTGTPLAQGVRAQLTGRARQCTPVCVVWSPVSERSRTWPGLPPASWPGPCRKGVSWSLLCYYPPEASAFSADTQTAKGRNNEMLQAGRPEPKLPAWLALRWLWADSCTNGCQPHIKPAAAMETNLLRVQYSARCSKVSLPLPLQLSIDWESTPQHTTGRTRVCAEQQVCASCKVKVLAATFSVVEAENRVNVDYVKGTAASAARARLAHQRSCDYMPQQPGAPHRACCEPYHL